MSFAREVRRVSAMESPCITDPIETFENRSNAEILRSNTAFEEQVPADCDPVPLITLVRRPKRLQHLGFDPSCDCWCCNTDLRFWCTMIGPVQIILGGIYAVALYVSYEPSHMSQKLGKQKEQQPMIDYRTSATPHYLLVTLLIGASSLIAAILIFYGSLKKYRALLFGHVVVTGILDLSLLWAFLLTWSPYMTAVYFLGILFNTYTIVASGALASHIKMGYYDEESDCAYVSMLQEDAV